MSTNRLLGILAALSLLAVPAVALAAKPDDPGKGNGQSQAAKSEAKAYGKLCKTESKKHVKGEKGTPFSRCVKAAAKLRADQEQVEDAPASTPVESAPPAS